MIIRHIATITVSVVLLSTIQAMEPHLRRSLVQQRSGLLSQVGVRPPMVGLLPRGMQLQVQRLPARDFIRQIAEQQLSQGEPAQDDTQFLTEFERLAQLVEAVEHSTQPQVMVNNGEQEQPQVPENVQSLLELGQQQHSVQPQVTANGGGQGQPQTPVNTQPLANLTQLVQEVQQNSTQQQRAQDVQQLTGGRKFMKKALWAAVGIGVGALIYAFFKKAPAHKKAFLVKN